MAGPKGGGYDPLARFRTDAVKEAEARQLRRRRGRIGLFVIALIAATALSMIINPPVSDHHSFTNASDYNSEKETGCTNSGKGCHGSESSYRDFNAYHPNSRCTTCHDYQGAGCIPCHTPGPNRECQLCHDGSMKRAADVVRITDPFPRGHYRETSHTALGTDLKAIVLAREDGTARATCGDCHSRDLRTAHTEVRAATGSTYGTSVGCGECHNDVRTAALAEVLDKWKARKCEDCHKLGSAVPMHDAKVATAVKTKGPQLCGQSGSGCHDVDDLHALHPDAPKTCSGSAKAGEPACHVLKPEAPAPKVVSCGAGTRESCHGAYVGDEYSHKRDTAVHSPKTTSPARDTSFHGTACGSCHRMDPGGRSLVDEHALATSARSSVARDVCRNCHNDPASADAVANDWKQRDTSAACDACHGTEKLPAAHEANLALKHLASGSTSCASTGAGCHPTSDLSQVGAPSTTTNIHRDCLRCHEWRQSNGNLAYDPARKSCGTGGTCHGSYSSTTRVHAGAAGRTDGTDAAHHTAGAAQAAAEYTDAASGVSTACTKCHGMTLATEHGRPNSSLATGVGTICVRCHDRSAPVSAVVKSSWPAKSTSAACVACHGQSGVPVPHAGIDSAHTAIELAADGTPTPGTCAKSGCHATTDLRRLHKLEGCNNTGCHAATGDIRGRDIKSCGGMDSGTGCHAGFATSHGVSHAADLTGTVAGIAYTDGSNVGCFGCHERDLRTEHDDRFKAGQMEGGGSGTCTVCHAVAGDPGVGAYADIAPVKTAIAEHDHRCVACHRSGSDADGSTGVASPHQRISTQTVLPDGFVWSDPFGDWRAAFDAVTGGGHNTLTASAVGGARQKDFPLGAFTIGGTVYQWALPLNSGDTRWLRPEVDPSRSLDTTAAIQSVHVACEDCHVMPADAVGPQGAAAKVYIDPDYSQTEYANPIPGSYQFNPYNVVNTVSSSPTFPVNATPLKPVVCYKCHSVFVGSVPGTVSPGGNSLHRTHARHGERCIDCHVRIPHAWKRPRLLTRTVVTTDGVAPDTFPYVSAGFRGLNGIRLKSFTTPATLTRADCAQGGCYTGSASTTSHPDPTKAYMNGVTYWP